MKIHDLDTAPWHIGGKNVYFYAFIVIHTSNVQIVGYNIRNVCSAYKRWARTGSTLSLASIGEEVAVEV
jgi:hypothetical protein